MLELCHIKKQYGEKRVLDNIEILFSHGIYGILGVNGAGKTTLMQIMTGLLQQDDGRVLYHGKDIRSRESGYQEQLGYMPQQVGLYPDFTAEEFLQYICVLKKIPKKERRERILTLLERVHLLDEEKKQDWHIFRGMKQRLGIAQAMLNQPEILILDEATAGLDPLERIRFRELIESFRKDRTIIFATHIIQDVETIADELILLGRGTVLAQNSPAGFLKEIKSGRLEDIFLFYECGKEE